MGQSGTLSLEKASLEQKVAQMEKERDSWMLQENLTKEVIASLNGENSALKSQVVELEELRSSLLQENHHLKETISDLQSQILNLEKTPVSSSSSTEIKIHPTENGDLAPQAEAADALVENLISENAALVEKVNEPYIELHYKRTRQEESLNGNFGGVEGSSEVVGGLQPNGGDAEMHGTSSAYNVMRDEASEKMEGLDLRMQALTKDGSNEYLGAKNTVLFQDSSEMIESDEIVQIPLDENEAEATDVEGSHDGEEEEEVPLVDAPLIGAPFRLISFVARYVSGADLVEKSSLKPGAT